MLGFRAFEEKVLSTVESRANARYSSVDILALTEMAEGWFFTATRLYFKRGERSLVQYFDEVVVGCLCASVGEKETMLGEMG